MAEIGRECEHGWRYREKEITFQLYWWARADAHTIPSSSINFSNDDYDDDDDGDDDGATNKLDKSET